MKLTYLHIVRQSLLYNIKGAFYQIIIIILLTAVITGSLMTGKSVRASLEKASLDKLGNTGIVVSSGIRYCEPSLADRISEKTDINCIGILEIEGYCQSFTTGQMASQVRIFAVDDDFFPFNGNDEIKIEKGETAVNERLADYLQLKSGDELIIRFNKISDIPADAPFSPGKDVTSSKVLKISHILKQNEAGNFSLGISQITPLNLFVNRSDLTDSHDNVPKINRILFDRKKAITLNEAYSSLKEVIIPEDIGLSLRLVPKTSGFEIISDRIFIDQLQVDEITAMQVESYPIITYLANAISKGNRFSPYSFISAIDSTLYPGVPSGNGIVINKWLADDLDAAVGDTVQIKWYSPDPMNHLQEENKDFIIWHIAEPKGIWADSLLMPEFPGIAGSKTCTDWDAGVSINTDLIRDKDEEYWNRYRGTPKAFINYSVGKKIWGNNFGPATSVRIKENMSEDQIREAISGSLDPSKSGFILTDLPAESIKSANESVDFSTLFLGLGFFIILSALILLILVVSTFYESKKKQITTLFSLGFTNRKIDKILFTESVIIALAGAVFGTFAGLVFNGLIINALNSVWQGAVQTNTLVAGFDIMSMVTGFSVSVLIILLILKFKSARFLKSLNTAEKGRSKKPSGRKNLLLSISSLSASILILVLSFIIDDYSTVLSFVAGIMVFASMILFTRQYYISAHKPGIYSFRSKNQISGSYFSFFPSQAIAPVLFLAAGLFAVIITGVNKMSISGNKLERSGGTGGYLLWGESSVPVRGNLASSLVRKEYGLDEPELKELFLVAARKKSGNDASCLNLNHIASPPFLGIDPGEFVDKGAFSFGGSMRKFKKTNPWSALDYAAENSTIYGIADQTVLQYGLKLKIGDTLKIRSETGQILNVIIAAGLKSSVFQGYVLIGSRNFVTFFPSVSGSQIFLADGNPELLDLYKNSLNDRLSEFGAHFEPAAEKLSSFFVVTNTYLSVFTILGGIGMILGVVGLGFILLRNFNQRKRDFGLMMASGFSLPGIRRIVFTEQIIVLLSGTLTGIISALIATKPSIINNSDIPWDTILVMIIMILAAGFTALAIAVGRIKNDTIISTIRKE